MSLLKFRPSAGNLSASPFLSRFTSLLCLITILAGLDSLAASGLAAHYGSSSGVVSSSSGRSCRSQNFIVSAPTSRFAQQVCAEAERFRRELAIEWLGRELPPWQDKCPIRVKVAPSLGAGGATSFVFINNQPRRWNMEIQGSYQRVLDSVLPHEITHTIMATHFGRPLPRWADEGAATSVEHTSERNKQDKLLIEFLTTNRGIAFNRMFAMREYPRDILPLYSQGYSLARYLIARGGKRKFVDYVGDGMRWNNWTRATEKHYGMQSLSELQVTWLDWVKVGSPPIDTAVAQTRDPQESPPVRSSREASSSAITDTDGLVPLPARRGRAGQAVPARVATAPSDGWYSRRRDEAMGQSEQNASSSDAGRRQHLGRPKQ